MLRGNKFYDINLNAPEISGEVNFTDWTRDRPSMGSSYLNNRFYGRHKTLPRVDRNNLIFDRYSHIPNLPANNPFRTIDNYEFALSTVGQEAPPRRGLGVGNALMTILDVMQRPQHMVTNVLSEITDDTPSSVVDVFRAAGQGITGARKSSITDTFSNLGWENDPSKNWYQGGNLARNILGFVGDVALDPTTYLTAGKSALVKGVGTTYLGRKGTKAIGETIQEILKDTGSKAATESLEHASQRVSRLFMRNQPSFVEEAQAMDKVNELLKKASGRRDKDVVMRIASGLEQMVDYTKPGVEIERVRGVVESILDKGLSGINRDIVNKLSTPFKLQLQNLTEIHAPKVYAGIKEHLKPALGRHFKGALRLRNLDEVKREATLGEIGSIIIGAKTTTVTPELKKALLENVYKHGVKDLPDDVLDAVTDREFGVLSTLIDAFGVKDRAQIDQMMGTAKTLNRLRTSTKEKIAEVSEVYAELNRNVRRISGGIEFSNGLQRVFNKADKAFYLSYHNPFTGTVKPLLELTNVARSPAARALWNAVVEMNPLSPAIGAMSTGLRHMFTTEGISKNISRLADGTIDPARYDAAKGFARYVSEASRKITALPHRAVNSVRAFSSIPKWHIDSSLRQAASFYIERTRSTKAQAAWLYLSRTPLEDTASDELKLAYQAVLDNVGDIKTKLDAINFNPTPENLDALKKSATINLIFNRSMAQFDQSMGKELKLEGEGRKLTPKEKEALGYLGKELEDKELEDYLRIYDDTPEEYLNPVALSHNERLIQKDTPLDLTRGIKKAEDAGTKTAVSPITGAYLRRKYPSVTDAMMDNPSHVYELDVNNRVARRTLESELVASHRAFVDGINDFMINDAGFRSLVSTEPIKGFEAISLGNYTLYSHPEIYNQLRRVTQVFNDMSTQERMIKQLYVNTSNVIKLLQTRYNLSFTLRNALSEPIMNWIAGVSPQSHSEAYSIMKEVLDTDIVRMGDTTLIRKGEEAPIPLFRQYKKTMGDGTQQEVLEDLTRHNLYTVGQFADLDKIKREIFEEAGVTPHYYSLGDREMNAQEILLEFADEGLRWSGITRGNLAKNMKGFLEQEILGISTKGGIKGLAKTLHEKAGAPGDFIETWTRLAHYIDGLKKGLDRRSAGIEVRKYHVDYKDLTNFERNFMRNLMPFYTYMRKNVPIQINLLLERQNKVNILGQLVDSSYEALQRDNNDQPLIVPDHLKEGLAIPISVDDEGNVQYLNWGIPIADLGRFKYNINELLMENIFAMWSPLLKAPLEATANRSMLFDRPLERYEGEGIPLLRNVEGSPRVSRLAGRLIQSLGVVNTLRTAVDEGIQAGREGENAVLAGARRALVGSFLPQRNQDDVALQQAYNYRDQLFAHIQRLREQGIQVPQYDERMQFNMPMLNFNALENRMEGREDVGTLGIPNIHLYPGLLRLLRSRQ